MADVAAVIYIVLAGATAIFQLALAAGAPWGEVSMGGRFPGRYPAPMRLAAVAFALLIAAMAAVVAARAGLAFDSWYETSRWLVWVVVAYSVIGLLMNLATPSKRERAIWAPVTTVMLVTSLIVALG